MQFPVLDGVLAQMRLDQVEEICRRIAEGVQKTDLAREYGVSRQMLYASIGASGAGGGAPGGG